MTTTKTNPNGNNRSATAGLEGPDKARVIPREKGRRRRISWLADAVKLPSFSVLHFVVMIQERLSSHPETSDGPNSGGKQTFLDGIK